jgi:uncharacterized membrane protein
MAPWFYAAMTALVFFGMHNVFVQKASRTGMADGTASFIMEGTAALLLAVYVFYNYLSNRGLGWHTQGAGYAALGGVCIAAGVVFYFRTYSLGAPLSIAGPLIYSGSVALTALTGLLLLKEPVQARHLAGIVASLVAIYLLRG